MEQCNSGSTIRYKFNFLIIATKFETFPLSRRVKHIMIIICIIFLILCSCSAIACNQYLLSFYSCGVCVFCILVWQTEVNYPLSDIYDMSQICKDSYFENGQCDHNTSTSPSSHPAMSKLVSWLSFNMTNIVTQIWHIITLTGMHFSEQIFLVPEFKTDFQ